MAPSVPGLVVDARVTTDALTRDAGAAEDELSSFLNGSERQMTSTGNVDAEAPTNPLHALPWPGAAVKGGVASATTASFWPRSTPHTVITDALLTKAFTTVGSGPAVTHIATLVLEKVHPTVAALGLDTNVMIMATACAAAFDKGTYSIDSRSKRFKNLGVSLFERDIHDGADFNTSALRLSWFFKLFRDADVLRKAGDVLSHIGVLGYARIHALGALAGASENSMKVARSGREHASARGGDSVVDACLERIAVAIGADVTLAEHRNAVYSYIKLHDRVGLGYDLLAQVDEDFNVQLDVGKQVDAVARFVRTTLNARKDLGDTWFVFELELTDGPRMKGGPAGARVLLQGVTSSAYLVHAGAAFGVRGLYSDLMIFGKAIQGLIPVRDFLHPAVMAAATAFGLGFEAGLVGANLKVARDSVRRINLAAGVIKEGITGEKVLSPADQKALAKNAVLVSDCQAYVKMQDVTVQDKSTLQRFMVLNQLGGLVMDKTTTDAEMIKMHASVASCFKQAEQPELTQAVLRSANEAIMRDTSAYSMHEGMKILDASQHAAKKPQKRLLDQVEAIQFEGARFDELVKDTTAKKGPKKAKTAKAAGAETVEPTTPEDAVPVGKKAKKAEVGGAFRKLAVMARAAKARNAKKKSQKPAAKDETLFTEEDSEKEVEEEEVEEEAGQGADEFWETLYGKAADTTRGHDKQLVEFNVGLLDSVGMTRALAEFYDKVNNEGEVTTWEQCRDCFNGMASSTALRRDVRVCMQEASTHMETTKAWKHLLEGKMSTSVLGILNRHLKARVPE